MVYRSADEMFKKKYGANKNFITPHVVKRGKIARRMAYELSVGSGMLDYTQIYGVTIISVNKQGKIRSHDRISKVFRTKAEALKYIEKLKKRFSKLKRYK